jgi:predicted transcriptional regulator
MKYRSRTDIVGLMLEAADGGATKTKIMYKAFLSYAQLKGYLTVLLQNHLLEWEEGKQNFRTTEKGLLQAICHDVISGNSCFCSPF